MLKECNIAHYSICYNKKEKVDEIYSEQVQENTTSLVEYKENIFKKIINRIMAIFKRN